ncbi:F0F1 ATP synthase subunit epsilon [Rhodospirillum rubrum]|uniref:ATP synthase epsilon chain n=2 Tax=Rhodospirillum rubrum TaxID=1085 RepID=ATPE_RHORT|nr:F0F1 ATP synthase subunit epsilon [Rhodospirillum rubrum]P05442.1 RecName: Full=ATP synthase epsilon chain; AltName: Full=ATP synthase F1 sector epsilon subunit; AltName: Full=F-ATPase epsilon subunit [Rhodospirillum rubrum]Q2RV17.1 RecName: Full=ATP synthase epsilon chain; AltName: Full=ATP synthase F1 sector epsilon subunit; AltName: Full=F-ATPase epsilon subunit [Rhodospirillum rubrum ATCC 11170]ABC22028.1 H+-transporting two-sector ATPase, delta/epsilon subunit [Rhodospirillum rubrum ATCC
MAETTEFELVSPERLLFSEPVEMVVVPGTDGDFGAMPRHAPLLSTVRPGVISTYNGGKVQRRIFVAGGFAEVTEDRCTVLADEAFDLASLSEEAVRARLQAADDRLKEATSEAEKAEAAQAKAIAEALLAARKG